MDNLLNNELKVKLDCFKNLTQMELFQNIDESMGALSEDQATFIEHYAFIRRNVRGLFPHTNLTGRPAASRESILKLFFMKAFLNLPTTKAARALVLCAYSWRRVCGFESTGEVPSESTLSRAFAEFSRINAIASIHSGLLKACVKETRTLLCNVSNDSTEIEAREHGVPKEKKPPAGTSAVRGRGRKSKAEKGNTPPPEPSNLERQSAASLEENLSRIPGQCDWGRKSNSKGKIEQWCGYKLHIGVADCGIVTSALLSSASMHDSQAAIPLMQMTARNVFFHMYDLMDAAYDSKIIKRFSTLQGRVAIIDPNKRNGTRRELEPAREEHYKCRTAVERTNSELKDSHGARFVMVKGAAKVFTHLMFGVVLVTVKHLLALLC